MERKCYTPKQKSAIAVKVIRRAVEISNTTPHDVFVAYSPHVDWISVHVHRGGWELNPSSTDLLVSFNKYDDAESDLSIVMAAFDGLAKDAKK